MGTVFQSFYKNLIFSKNCDIFYFFTALQFCKRTKGLYKMTYVTTPFRVS